MFMAKRFACNVIKFQENLRQNDGGNAGYDQSANGDKSSSGGRSTPGTLQSSYCMPCFSSWLLSI